MTEQREAGSDHQASEPAILYFGTPVVVLVSTGNEDGTANLSAWWPDWRAALGFDAGSKSIHPLNSDDFAQAETTTAVKTRTDPDRRQPLITSSQRFYGLAPSELVPSSLAQLPEAAYRSPDIDRARDGA